VQRDAGSGLRCHHFACDSLSSDHTWHYHPEYELTWVLRSRGTRFIGDNVAPYSRGDLVLIGPNVPHRWRDDPADGSETPELIVIQFDASCLGEQFLVLPEAAAIRRLLEESVCGLQFDSAVVSRVGPLLEDVAIRSGMDRLIRFIEILHHLSESGTRSRLARPEYLLDQDINPTHRKRLELVYDLVHARLAGEISQVDVATAVGLSPSAFSRFFRAATGRTFVCFVNLVRVSRVCRLLGSTELSITAIALDCGYGNLSNFNRQFHALEGMSPTEFRRHAMGHESPTSRPGVALRLPRAHAARLLAQKPQSGRSIGA
jgi:AraC-like DNA-binding protein